MSSATMTNAVVGTVLGIFELAFPIAIISGIYWHLDDVWVELNTPNGNVLYTWVETSCLLNSDYNSSSLCTYSYWVCGVSLFFTLVLMIALWAAVDSPHQLHGAWIAPWLLFIWWLICAAIVTADVKKAMEDNSWQNSWRQSVVTCQWVMTIFLFVQFLAAVATLFFHKRKAKKALHAKQEQQVAAGKTEGNPEVAAELRYPIEKPTVP